MASSTSITTERLPPAPSTASTALRQTWGFLSRPITAIAFWLAVLLPLVHLVVIVSGLDSTGDYMMLTGSLMMNVGALFLGRGYGQN